MNYLLVAAGGALGALARLLVSKAASSFMPVGFPWGTLTVNVLGSFALGAILVFIQSRGGEGLKFLLMTGFIGAFTTFSTFSLEVIELMQNGYLYRSLLNICANVVLCVAGIWSGLFFARIFYA